MRAPTILLAVVLSATACTDEPPRELIADVFDATSSECPDGGRRIVFGYDADADGTLTSGEVTDEAVVCDGAPGQDGATAPSWQIATFDEPPGDACRDGGIRVAFGVDTNGDGNLDENEATDVRYVCGGGADARVDGARIDPGPECSAGGFRIRSFRDANGDGAAQPAEVVDDIVLCDPARAIVQTSVEDTSTSTTCARGGVRIDVGLDDDADGRLAESEIDQSTFACNGAARTLVDVRTEPAGANCTDGGYVVDTGYDEDDDDVLDTSEVRSTAYICAGSAGVPRTAVRVDVEAPGANCLSGGHRLQTGPDTDGDGVLDAGEVANTSYLCSTPAQSSLVTISPVAPGAICGSGGQRIDSGLDVDGDLTLDPPEITHSAVLCNGGGGGGVQILSNTVSPGATRVPYVFDIVVAGGTPAYAWSVASGALPPGLRLEPTTGGAGRIFGVPTMSGTFNVVVQVADTTGSVASRSFQLVVAPRLVIETARLPAADVGQPYTATIVAAGGTGAHTWSIAAGQLPAGLSLANSTSATVQIVGTPTARAPASFVVQVEAGGATAVASMVLGFREVWLAAEKEDIFNPGLNELEVSFVGGATPGPAIDVSGTLGTLGQIDDPLGIVFSPTQERVVFTTNIARSVHSVSLGSNGTTTAAAPITSAMDTYDPRWSPTGAHLAYIQRVASGRFDVRFVPVTPTAYGTSVRANPPLQSNETAEFVAWSPDGSLVLTNVRQPNAPMGRLFLRDVNSPTGPVALTPPSAVRTPTFSNDSRFVYFTADLDTVGQIELFRVDVSGASPGAPEKLSGSLTTLGDVDSFGLSLAGDRVFYIADQVTDGQRQLYVVDLAGTISAPRLVSPSFVGAGQEVYIASWSPDGASIAFAGDLIVDGRYELFLAGATPNATGPFVISAPLVPGGDVGSSTIPRDGDIGWSPDGRRLFYIADAVTDGFTELFAVNLHGAPTIEAVSVEGSTNLRTSRFEITPDGRRVAYGGQRIGHSKDISAPTLSSALVIGSLFSTTSDVYTTYLRSGAAAAIFSGSAYRIDLANQTTAVFAGPAQMGETYLWTIAPP